MRKQMREETQMQKDASDAVGQVLLKRCREQREDEAKRRKEAQKEEWLAAKTLEDTRLATAKVQQTTAETKLAAAKAQGAAAECRLERVRQIVVNRRDAEITRKTEALEKLTQTWMQTRYPVLVARDCIDGYASLTPKGKQAFGKEVAQCVAEGLCRRQLYIVSLWDVNKSILVDWAAASAPTDGRRREVRCCVAFEQLIDEEAAKGHFGKDPVETLFKLWELCVPHARQIFTGSYNALRVLHQNDYVMEKAFVWGILALSKWLGRERFPQGIYGAWPPKMPASQVPENLVVHPVHVGDPVPPLPAPPAADDAALPPNQRKGKPPASSNG
jgi:hypothetical protein